MDEFTQPLRRVATYDEIFFFSLANSYILGIFLGMDCIGIGTLCRRSILSVFKFLRFSHLILGVLFLSMEA